MERAQLLQGLRTGGPRSTSFGNQPMSANPTTTRFATNAFQPQLEDPSAQFVDRFQNLSLNSGIPMSATPDAAIAARLQAQQQQQQQLIQQAQLAALMAAQGGNPVLEAQAMQMQIEIMKLQALQQQQNFQAQIMLQAQLQQQQQINQGRRLSELQQVPSSAGPLTSTFQDASAAQTRMAAANQLRLRAAGREASLKASVSDEQVNVNPPMSAAIGGKFGGGRAVSSPLNPNAAAFVGRFNPELAAAIAAAPKPTGAVDAATPATPTYGSTTVISGGTPLGGAGTGPNSPSIATPPNSYNGLSGYNNSSAVGPTKSDSAVSWRRGSGTPTTPDASVSKSPSPPLRNRSVSPPMSSTATLSKLNVTSTVPSSGPVTSPLKTRPSPLRFASPPAGSGPVATLARSGSPSGSVDGQDIGSGLDEASSKSSPTSSTPPSSAGSNPLSKEREEASKKLYEGLGLGRPAPSPVRSSFNPNAVPFTLNTSLPTFITTAPTPGTPSMAIPAIPVAPTFVPKMEPVRQPMGPPCPVDELGPLNFASRLGKRAVGGLGVLADARERREVSAAMASEVVVY